MYVDYLLETRPVYLYRIKSGIPLKHLSFLYSWQEVGSNKDYEGINKGTMVSRENLIYKLSQRVEKNDTNLFFLIIFPNISEKK